MSQQIVECNQCEKVPDDYLCLNCDHTFCLVCMAQNFLRGGRIFQNPENKGLMYICSMCEQETQLDEASVAAIDIILQQILIPCLDQVNQQKVILEESQEQEQKDVQTNQEPSQIQEITQPLDSYVQTPTKTISPEHNSCEKHSNEEMNIFCFTCEAKCFCVKCLIQFNHHKNHDVQNVQLSMNKLKSKMNEANHTISASIELLNLQKKRILDQDQQNISQIEDFKKLFQTSFDNLYKQIKTKEKEMLSQMAQLTTTQQQSTSNLIKEITIKVNTLDNLKQDFERISSQKKDHLQPSVSLFNFFSDCKQIMQKVLGQINFGEILYGSGSANLKYFPEYNEQFFNAAEFDDRVQLIKGKIEEINKKNAGENNSLLFRSFSQHEKNWIQPTVNNSISKRCNTQQDDEMRFKSKVCVKVITGKLANKTPDSSMHYLIENSFQRKKQLLSPIVPQSSYNPKSLLDDFTSMYSDRLASNNKEEAKSQASINLKRSISELSPKQQISSYFKMNRQNPLNILMQQQGQFYKSRLLNDSKIQK